MIEVWKQIAGYESKYDISSLGRVRSHCFNREMILKPRISRGYGRVVFFQKSRAISHLVHRLVAQAFIPNPGNLPQVNHIDGDKRNNAVENLEWCNARHNQLHAVSLGLTTKKIGEAHPMTPFKNSDILDIREAYKKGESQQRLADRFGVNQTSISAIIRRTTWSHI